MSNESKAFLCGMLCLAGFSLIPGACCFLLLRAESFQAGYRIGYVTALVNQSKGNDHEFKLVEQKNGELLWEKGRSCSDE